MTIPSTIAAGDTVAWSEDLGCFAAGAELSYALRGPGQGINVTVNPDGSASLNAAQTSALNATPADVLWYWQRYAVIGGGRSLVGEGQLRVKPNLAVLNGTFDGASQTQKDLAAVKAAISVRISGGLVQAYTVGSRNLQKEPIAQLLALQSKLEARLRREKARAAVASGLPNPSKSLARFRNGGGNGR